MNVPKRNRFVFVGKGEKKCSNVALKIGPENENVWLEFIFALRFDYKKDCVQFWICKIELKTIIKELKTLCFPSVSEDEDKLVSYYKLITKESEISSDKKNRNND